MKLYKKGQVVLLEHEEKIYRLNAHWDELVNRKNLFHFLLEHLKTASCIEANDQFESFDPPIGSQELWAAGVTYLRSKEAREKESAQSGGGSFYDKVYEANRPELFFKSLASRIAGHNAEVHIRKDSSWDVPEPELTLFICSEGTIEGYTIGNDMSSRSIEGENPLYLAQAKVYDRSASIGPCLLVLEQPIQPQATIRLKIFRNESLIFNGETSLSKMKRSLEELASYLFLETSFPNGVMLMTGTGIVPPDNFTLHVQDRIEISIDGIGTLVNHVVKKS